MSMIILRQKEPMAYTEKTFLQVRGELDFEQKVVDKSI